MNSAPCFLDSSCHDCHFCIFVIRTVIHTIITSRNKNYHLLGSREINVYKFFAYIAFNPCSSTERSVAPPTHRRGLGGSERLSGVLKFHSPSKAKLELEPRSI